MEVFQAVQKHHVGSESKTGSFNPKIKRRTNLETQLLEVRHMSRLELFYHGLPNSVSEPAFWNVCGLPLKLSLVQVPNALYLYV